MKWRMQRAARITTKNGAPDTWTVCGHDYLDTLDLNDWRIQDMCISVYICIIVALHQQGKPQRPQRQKAALS